jgi:hypothetical protein
MPEQAYSTIALIVINILTIIPPTIMAYAVLKQGAKTDKKADDIIARTSQTGDTTDDLVVRTVKIAEATDGNLTAVRRDLEQANERIIRLNEIVMKLAEEAKKSDDIIDKLDKLDKMFNGDNHNNKQGGKR